MLNESINKLNQSELEGSNTPCLPKPIGILHILNMRVTQYKNTPLLATLAIDPEFPAITLQTIKCVMRMEIYG